MAKTSEDLPEPYTPPPDPERAYCEELARRMLTYETDPKNFLKHMRLRKEFHRIIGRP